MKRSKEKLKTQAKGDQRRNDERAIALLDLLTTIFADKADYQDQFVSIGSIGVVTELLKLASSLEGSPFFENFEIS